MVEYIPLYFHVILYIYQCEGETLRCEIFIQYAQDQTEGCLIKNSSFI